MNAFPNHQTVPQVEVVKELQEEVVKVLFNVRKLVGKLDTNEPMRMQQTALIMMSFGVSAVEVIVLEKVT